MWPPHNSINLAMAFACSDVFLWYFAKPLSCLRLAECALRALVASVSSCQYKDTLISLPVSFFVFVLDNNPGPSISISNRAFFEHPVRTHLRSFTSGLVAVRRGDIGPRWVRVGEWDELAFYQLFSLGAFMLYTFTSRLAS